jgi:hypothetical protein
MSASDELPAGEDPSPNSVLTGTIGFLNAGGDLGTLLQGALFGTLVSVSQGGINLVQSAFNLVVTPIDLLVDAAGSFVEAVFIEPLGIVETGAATSAGAIAAQFGVFGFIVSIVVLLGGFYVIQQYLEDRDTSDIIPIPGVPDAPAIGPIDPGVTEEGEDEADE